MLDGFLCFTAYPQSIKDSQTLVRDFAQSYNASWMNILDCPRIWIVSSMGMNKSIDFHILHHHHHHLLHRRLGMFFSLSLEHFLNPCGSDYHLYDAYLNNVEQKRKKTIRLMSGNYKNSQIIETKHTWKRIFIEAWFRFCVTTVTGQASVLTRS